MIEMGRKKTSHPDLPPRMVARVLASGKRLFYYGRNKIPLGADINQARIEWAKLENAGLPFGDKFPTVSREYERTVIPNLRQSSQREYVRAIRNLEAAFRTFSLEEIRPVDVKDYMRQRSSKVAAIREKSVLSALFKWAREEGMTAAANPCQGVGFTRHEKRALGITGKRSRYVTDDEFEAVWQKADEVTRDVMDLCLLTGQRLGDVIRWTRQDIRDGRLIVAQAKTGNALEISIEGKLDRVIQRILTRPRPVQTMYLIADAKGQKLSVGKVDSRFRKVKSDWQMRDLRAKAATDSPNLKDAQRLLGHSTEQTTTIYRRDNQTVVKPLR